MLVFLYDEAGSPVGFLYRTSEYAQNEYDTYFYEKNFFGDVIAIYNESGSCVARYAYNAWGEHTVSYNSNGIAEMNPIRYRGYYYDTHTGLYYLQSRYYNPAWGRFISADCYVSTGQGLLGNNMYIYCNNNPVMYVDPEGESIVMGAICITLIIVGAVGLSSCSPSRSEIEDDLHMYEEGKGGPQEGKINIKFRPDSDNPSIQIEDSYKITNRATRRKILKCIMDSPLYSDKIYDRSLRSMMIEWDMHNWLNDIYEHERLKSVDLDKDAEGMSTMDHFGYAVSELINEKYEEAKKNVIKWYEGWYQ